MAEATLRVVMQAAAAHVNKIAVRMPVIRGSAPREEDPQARYNAHPATAPDGCCIIPAMPPGFGPFANLRVGHAQDASARTGCTVLLATQGAAAAALVLAGGPGERELQTLHPAHLVERIDALLFAGGSAFGLDAAGGVMRWCAERHIGFDTGIAQVPIVPAAILFDLGLGATRRPDADMGYAAAEAAAQPANEPPNQSANQTSTQRTNQSARRGATQGAITANEYAAVPEGNVGAGAGCTVGKLFGLSRAMKSGIGCWTEHLPAYPGGYRDAEPDANAHSESNVPHSTDSHTDSSNASRGPAVAALAAVNAFGDVCDPATGRILAGARGRTPIAGNNELLRDFVNTAAAIRQGIGPTHFGDRGGSDEHAGDIPNPSHDARSPSNTVLVAVATDAALTRVEAGRVARMAAAGMARTLSPAHTTFDGDIIFVLSVGRARADLNAVGSAAAEAVAQAIVRGVTQAHSAHGIPGLAGTPR